MLWFALGVMCFAGVIFAIWPFLRDNSRKFGLVAGAVVFVVGGSAGLYSTIGSPNIPSAGSGQVETSLDEVITSLASRLENEPNDANGWRLLGRSYMQVGNYSAAIGAFERVVELESAQNAQGLVDLGQAMLAHSGQAMNPRIASLFENALALEPNNPAALFWGGIAAIERGDKAVAADRMLQPGVQRRRAHH